MDEQLAKLKQLAAKAHAAWPDIQNLQVEYDGSEDNGQLEDIYPFPEDAAPAAGNAAWDALCEDIINYLYEVLEYEHGGWENNGGAYGTFVLTLATGALTLEHNDRYMSTSTSNNSWE